MAAVLRFSLFHSASLNFTCKQVISHSIYDIIFAVNRLTKPKGILYPTPSLLGEFLAPSLLSLGRIALIRRSLEQNVGIIAGCMPSLHQLHNLVKRKRHDQRSNSVQNLCEDGQDRRKASMKPSPISPQAESFNPSPVSTAFSRQDTEVGQDFEEVKNWSPRLMDAPRFDRPSLTPEQAQTIQEYHREKVEERRASCVELDKNSSNAKQLSPTATRFDRTSLSPRQAQAMQEYRMGKSEQNKPISAGRRYSENPKNWSPRLANAPKFARQSLNAEQAQSIQQHSAGKAPERKASWVDKYFIENTEKSWSPRGMDSPRFDRPSLTPEQALAIREYHLGKVEEEKSSSKNAPGKVSIEETEAE